LSILQTFVTSAALLYAPVASCQLESQDCYWIRVQSENDRMTM